MSRAMTSYACGTQQDLAVDKVQARGYECIRALLGQGIQFLTESRATRMEFRILPFAYTLPS